MRLSDNPALNAASEEGLVLPVFVLDDRLWGPAGDARRAFLVGCLEAVDRATDGHLSICRGDPAEQLANLCRSVGASAVYAAADFGPYGRSRDDQVVAALASQNIPLHWVGSPYAVDPGSVVKGDGTPFKVFTPFSRAWASYGWDVPAQRAARISWADGPKEGEIPGSPSLAASLPTAGEEAGLRRWERFRDGALADYAARRDSPSGEHTSRMSTYLKWGCVHPRTLLADLDVARRGDATYRSELCWREFYADVLWHVPGSARRALQPRMASMELDEGADAERHFRAWSQGLTGYPIVDAGMRQLRAEGWMHNRVRMIVASFLVKDLHIDWVRGARWFLAHLVDGDLASNNHGWQWVAGTGTDAAPYFRVFNPTTQGAKFDPEGDYVRQFVPELRGVAGKAVHEPWKQGVPCPGYPARIVDHARERAEALTRYRAVRA